MAELELDHSDHDVRNRPSVGQDEAIPHTQHPKRKRPTARSPSKIVLSTPRRNFTKEQVQILLSWVDKHIDNPYAEPEQLKELADQTGLTAAQVKEWLTRHRKRKMANLGSTKLASTSSMDVESSSSSLQENRSQYSSLLLETYLDTPLQNEPFPPFIALNLQKNPSYFSGYNPDRNRRQSTLNTAQSGVKRTRRLSSQQSGLSGPTDVAARRPKGKKGQRIIQPRPTARERQGDEKFQCTVCSRGFRYQCDWARHEETHDPQKVWICMPDGPRLFNTGDITCPFCGESNPRDEHLTSEHKANLCLEKPEGQRSFNRSDGLVRHMKEFHGASIHTAPSSWVKPKYEIGDPHFWCGFCQKLLHTTWDSRLKHVGDHYTKDDCQMTGWVDESEFRNESSIFGPIANPGFEGAANLDLDGATNFECDGHAGPEFDGAANLKFDGHANLDFDRPANLDFDGDTYPDLDSMDFDLSGSRW